MDVTAALRASRRRAGLSQAQLAARAGTSQASVSAYERGRKDPSVQTLERLLRACGATLTVAAAAAVVLPSPQRQRRAARDLLDVLALAAELPTRHGTQLSYPRLPAGAR